MSLRDEYLDIKDYISKDNPDKQKRKEWRRLVTMWIFTVIYIVSVPVLLVIKAIKGYWPITVLPVNLLYFVTLFVLIIFSTITIIYGIKSDR